MEDEASERYLDTQGYNTADGEFISLRNASPVGVTEIAGRHHLQVYSTADHRMHTLQGDSFATEEDARDRIDAADRGMKNVMFEDNVAPNSDGEIERWEERKKQIEREASARGY